MARLDVFTLTLDMSPVGQNLFTVEPILFDLNSLVVDVGSFDILGQSVATGEFFVVRAAFSVVAENEAVINSFDVFNIDGTLAASISDLDFSLAGPVDPFGVGLGAFLTGDDLIFGAAGNDVIFGGSGFDGVDGGLGLDTALYSGASDQYSVALQGNIVQVTDLVGGRDGIDTLANVELFDFSDGLFSVSGLLAGDDVDRGVYRFFSTGTNTHFYTASAAERDAVLDSDAGFAFEGAVFRAVEPTDVGADPVFRFFNTQTGVHFYTISTDERDAILASAPQFVLEGEAYFAHDTAEAGTIPLFRFFNTATGTHFYTASADERDVILNSLPEFIDEGTAYFVEGIA